MRRFLSFRDFDWALLGMVLLLSAISVAEIYSATRHTRFASFETKQMLWIAAGMVGMFILAKIDYHRLLDWSPWMYAVFLVSLVAVKVMGRLSVLGARRWISVGPIQFQPCRSGSKLVLILVVARASLCQSLDGRNPDLAKRFLKPLRWWAFPWSWC